MTRPTPESARAAGVDGHQYSTRSATGNATPLNGLSTSSGTPGPWPPATTSATTCTEAPSHRRHPNLAARPGLTPFAGHALVVIVDDEFADSGIEPGRCDRSARTAGPDEQHPCMCWLGTVVLPVTAPIQGVQ